MHDDVTEPQASSGPLLERLTSLRDALKTRARVAETLRKALSGLDTDDKLQRVDLVVAAHAAFAAAAELGDDVAARSATLAAELEQHLRELRRSARSATLQALEKATRDEGLGLEVVTESPLVVLIAPFTVELDLDAGRAELQYARAAVNTVGLDATDILEARREAMASIRADSLEGADFFDLLHTAYRVALLGQRGKPGDRIDLVDLLPALALLRVQADQWRRTPMRKIADYPRYLLAYQLNRMRREGVLEKAGWRIDLGTATGGAARNKLNVLFLPNSHTDGQYYLSIRFVQA